MEDREGRCARTAPSAGYTRFPLAALSLAARAIIDSRSLSPLVCSLSLSLASRLVRAITSLVRTNLALTPLSLALSLSLALRRSATPQTRHSSF